MQDKLALGFQVVDELLQRHQSRRLKSAGNGKCGRKVCLDSKCRERVEWIALVSPSAKRGASLAPTGHYDTILALWWIMLRLNGFHDHIPLVCCSSFASSSPVQASSIERCGSYGTPSLGTRCPSWCRLRLDVYTDAGFAHLTATTWKARIAKFHQPCLSSARLLGCQI